jgi:hypothetical protein
MMWQWRQIGSVPLVEGTMRLQRMTSVWFPILAAIWMTPALAASSSEAPAFRCPPPGTVIVTTTGITVALRDGPPMHCVATVNGVETDTILHMVARDDEHASELRDEISKIWPLVVGTSRTFYVGLPGEPIVNHIAVKARTAIDTPAGHFDTYVIEWSRFAANCGAILDEVDRYFYAPGLGAMVRHERDYGYGNDKLSDTSAQWEAIRVRAMDQALTAMSRRRPPSPRSSMPE